ncbi:MAG: glycoside hydrolase family 3 N-terminal domain-containing protein [Bacteroidota bacterium]|nr:glycoside hydrolase family 3 N-terminal domain-containing protein [Bacteroidota bacterium]MDP4215556.1 glycoside hydrolase family 3 N-terminal domain-containing protein [Bacteroidota bacterium]MDP4244776.1 glycoside hydrolase family 3 N-terminal domain-containing protein [Bacteroidota bacterium]
MKKWFVLSMFLVRIGPAVAQFHSSRSADAWVDSVFRTLSCDQKIAQLMVVRMSGFDPVTHRVVFYDQQVDSLVRQYDVGGICLFQGGPLTQAGYINYFQRITRTPILFCIDAENGVGMRMDSVTGLPRQMMLGATQDPELIYRYGRLVGAQCRRIGVQVDYAPVVDINNNPDNPVINDRSFGEDKYKVAQFGVQYMRGLQEEGVMACAKHFPGHGDVSVDSHLDLPVITKSRKQLDSLELYPFRQLFRAGVGSVMIAHLYIPAIDNTPNQATSLSKKNVTKLLRKQLHYNGISFTDALEMKGVSKFYPDESAAVQSLIAGNDMLCLPGDVPLAIRKIDSAIQKRQLKWKDIDARVKKVLYAKYTYGLANYEPVSTAHLVADLNAGITDMRREVAENALTLLRCDDSSIFPLRPENLPSPAQPTPAPSAYRKSGRRMKVAYIGMGLTADNEFSRRMRSDYNAQCYDFDYSLDSIKAAAALELLSNRYDVLVIGVHDYARFPAHDFGISGPAIWLMRQLQERSKTITLVFGNPYAIRNFCDAKILLACYEDDEITQDVAADLLNGKFTAKGKLPVTICPSLKVGDGITGPDRLLPQVPPVELGFDPQRLQRIDTICREMIAKEAAPGCVVLVAKGGKIAYERAFGHLSYDHAEPVYKETIYDMASCTKICATTMAVMKLYDEGRLDVHKTLGDYLPWVKGTDKASLRIWDVLLHQAGLKAFIPFYKETIDSSKEGFPSPDIYSPGPDSTHGIRVAEGLYIRNDWQDTLYARILDSKLGPKDKYIYSDNDFIFMGKVVEALTGMTLDQYVKKTFYDPLGMSSAGFKPREHFPLARIAPTEQEAVFRKQLLRGDVHDPGSAMFGGVAGHAGLFSDAYDLALLEQMLLNGGTLNGHTYLKRSTIDFFTAYHSGISRRGLGFDKPEKDNARRKEPYPCFSASPETFGHTGYTGTCVWVDPKYDLIFIFLSNRVNPWGGDNLKLSSLNIRSRIQETVYQALGIDLGVDTGEPGKPGMPGCCKPMQRQGTKHMP